MAKSFYSILTTNVAKTKTTVFCTPEQFEVFQSENEKKELLRTQERIKLMEARKKEKECPIKPKSEKEREIEKLEWVIRRIETMKLPEKTEEEQNRLKLLGKWNAQDIIRKITSKTTKNK